MFDAVLVANRGEIACRVTRTLRRLGIRAIAVYSDADRGALHATLADEAVRIGPAPAAESYLRIDAILGAAARTGAQAIHPGYGFLAENAGFARACAEAGLVFIGPTPQAMAIMGAKDRAKAAMIEADVPVVPGYHGEAQDEASLRETAARLGFPLLVKAAAGGGGKGMRLVEDPAGLAAALEGAKREAKAAFGDDRMLLERYVRHPRHIEVQVFGDRSGNVVHLFERDCSVQRRHQKVIEEAPAPGLGEERRAAICSAAVRAAQAIGYINAGTVEFLMDEAGRFYFLEMNTRLQVEHPITEMITGLDLVEWQLRVAAGEPLPLGQDAIARHGHAIEARLYAEDPGRGFLPATGRLDHLAWPPEGPGLRVETGVRQGDRVTTHYDPLLAKLVVWDRDRAGALRQLRAALAATEMVGPTTNLDFLARVAASAELAAGGVDTGWVERAQEELCAPPEGADEQILALAAAWLLQRQQLRAAAAAAASPEPGSPWHRVDGWRLNDVGHQTLRLRTAERTVEIHARTEPTGHRLEFDQRELSVVGRPLPDGRLLIELVGATRPVRVVEQGDQLHLITPEGRFRVDRFDPLAAAEAEEEGGGLLTAPMPGRIVRQPIKPGEHVARGAALLVLEAMKMEHTIVAPSDGRVQAIHFVEGDQVEEGAVLLDFERAGAA